VVPGYQRECAGNYTRHLITKGFCVNQKVLATTEFCSSFLPCRRTRVAPGNRGRLLLTMKTGLSDFYGDFK
jgi:hypothetical protein